MNRWARLRHEAVAVVHLATPVVLTQVGMMLMGVVDAMMLGRHSELALAAGALGNSVGFGLTSFPMGVLMALDPLVAQAFGSGSHERVGRHLKRGLILAAALAVPLSLLMWRTEGALRLVGQRPEIVTDGAAYLRVLIIGNLPFLLFVAMRQTLQAMSLVRPAVLAIVLANLFNVAANYTLIFGHFGFPALGVVGSAYATSISRWVMLLTLAAAAFPVLRRYLAAPSRAILVPRAFWRTLKLGFPIGTQLTLEMGLFMTVALMMGNLGSRELAAHQIALTLAALSFMVPLGISGAAATRAGNAIGRRDMDGARRSALVCLMLGAAVMSIAALAFALAPWHLSRLFTTEEAVIAVAVTLLPIAAVFQVSDGVQVVAIGALRGAADTRFPALTALVGFWGLGMPLAAYLGFRTDMGPRGLWWGITLGLSSVAVLLLARLRFRFAGDLVALEDPDPD
ncbi:MAG: MATE family efflux transporter [bacterium]|nr:MATE family efflux transporter [bacterium]